MNLFNIINDTSEAFKELSKTEHIIYSLIASALIIAAIWVVSKVVKFVFKIFRKK